MQMINEHTPTKVSHKRGNDVLNESGENSRNKKYARAFTYDKEKHVYETENFRKETYLFDRADGNYKVNVMKKDKSVINRIGLGKDLSRLNFVSITTCKKVSWNNVSVHFESREEANRFVQMENELNEMGYTTFIPIYFRSVVGVITNVPVDISAKEIFDEISQSDDLSQKVLKIERMPRRMRNGHRDYSLSVKITFGTDELPSNVSIYHGLERVKPYIPPVQQCTGCLKYGHQIYACKAKNLLLCSFCGIKGHDKSACAAAQPICIHCKGVHDATAKECLERKRQENIRILMSGKNLSYREVLEKFPTYASKNQFDLLVNIDEFPTLKRESYKDQLTGKNPRRFYFSNKKQIYAKKQPDANSQYYSQFKPDTLQGKSAPFRENRHRVSEFERTSSLMSQAKATSSKFANEDSICDFMNDSTITENNDTKINSMIQSEEINNKMNDVNTNSNN